MERLIAMTSSFEQAHLNQNDFSVKGKMALMSRKELMSTGSHCAFWGNQKGNSEWQFSQWSEMTSTFHSGWKMDWDRSHPSCCAGGMRKTVREAAKRAVVVRF